jgi:hypothetical protein
MAIKRKISKQNYFSALLEISNVPDFNPLEIHRKHHVANAFTTVCVELGYVKRVERSKSKWMLLRQPLMSDVIMIKKRLRARMMEKKDGVYTRQTYKEKQLTIQPIKPLKRVASLVEPPVHPIEMHNDAQLTWMHLALIFCAGILAGGLIATIWK